MFLMFWFAGFNETFQELAYFFCLSLVLLHEFNLLLALESEIIKSTKDKRISIGCWPDQSDNVVLSPT